MSQFHTHLNGSPFAQQTASLSMMLYSCYMVHQLAQGSRVDDRILRGITTPILQLNTSQPSDLFCCLDTLDNALLVLINLLEGKRPQAGENEKKNELEPADRLSIKYMVLYTHGAMKLRKLLLKDPAKVNTLTDRIPIIKRFQELQCEDYNAHSSIITKLAALYLDLFGQLQFRIMVQGTPGALRAPSKVECIRCLLLGAIRFSVLWYQVGGRQWHFIFQRGKLLREAQTLRKLLKTAKLSTNSIVRINP